MCGRFALSAKTSNVEKLVPDSKLREPITPRYNIAPTQNIKALLNDGGKEIIDVRWGLIPFWAKDKSIGSKMINARAETIAEKASFKNPFKKRRCLIYSDGFYEWKKVPGSKKKVPHFVRMKDREPFTFAGLWDIWKNPEGGKIISAVIITTDPNELMSEIYDRMPAILAPDERDLWIGEGESAPGELLSALKPYPSEGMELYEVSTNVNNPAFDDPSCIEPVLKLI